MLKPGATLEGIAKRVADEKIDPKPRSGRQEFFENLVNPLSLTRIGRFPSSTFRRRYGRRRPELLPCGSGIRALES